ncbi:unnamed protein product [Sympodiomycopsis kandeliae]
MSWRSNAQRTGENAAPLQNARRWGGGGGGGSPNDTGSAFPSGGNPYGAPYGGPQGNGNSSLPSVPSAAAAAASRAADIAAKLAGGVAVGGSPGLADKRDREDGSSVPLADDGAPRKRRSRWGDAAPAANVTTAIRGAVSAADLDRYAVSVRLDEISNKLRSGDVVPPDRERSPSPPPVYDTQGRRTNTREVRYRKKLEDERVALVEKQMKLDPNYRPPAEYHATKRNRQPTEKVYLPLKEFPEINFFGLLVGPRGNTLKKMERESGAKIAIRGKGSVKEGKGRGNDEDEEDMHCVITADDDAKIKLCIQLINKVIETAASTPESQNDHKRNQLRELATLNGTLRDDENQVCQNCGNKGHRRFECTESRNHTAHIICHRCGGQGHLARDCTQGRPGFGGGPGFAGSPPGANGAGGAAAGGFDSEYASLMAELGEGGAGNGASGAGSGRAGSGSLGPGTPQPPFGAGGASGSRPTGQGQAPIGPDGKKIPPWRQPDIWNAPGFSAHGGGQRGPRIGGGGFGGGAAATGSNAYGAGGGQGWSSAPNYQGDNGGYAQQGYGAGGWGGAQQQQQGHGAEAGTNGDGQKDYSAEWAAYYAAQQQQQQQPQQGGDAAAQGQEGANGDQKDYTKEWEEYYRQQAAMQQQQQPPQ